MSSPYIVPQERLNIITVANPAAGADFTYTIPTGKRHKILSIAFRFVTSSVVATRVPGVLNTDSGGKRIAAGYSAVGQTASLNRDWVFAFGATRSEADASTISVPMPPMVLDAGCIIQSLIASIDVGDQISNIRITVLEIDF